MTLYYINLDLQYLMLKNSKPSSWRYDGVVDQHHRSTLVVDHSQYDGGSRARQVASSTLSLAVHALCRISVKQEEGLGTGSVNI